MLKKVLFLAMLPAVAHAVDCETLTTYQRVERSASMSAKPKVTSSKPIQAVNNAVVYRKPVVVPAYKKVVTSYDCLSSSPKVTPSGTIRIGDTFFHGNPFVWGAPPFGSPEPIFTYPAALNFAPAPVAYVPARKPIMPADKPEHPVHPDFPVTPIAPIIPVESPSTTVPEPAPLSLLLLGLGLISFDAHP
jgi:hypothetical protein